MKPLTLQQLQTRINLITDGKVLNFTQFKERVDCHTYGTGRYPGRIFFLGHPRQNCFGFYPQRDTKAVQMKQAYEMYKELHAGDMDYYLRAMVQWGDCGIPICYGHMRKSETNELFDNEIWKSE